MDARKLAELLRGCMLSPVYHARRTSLRTLQELARSYRALTKDTTRVMSRLKAVYRGWGIACGGQQVYAPRYREAWLKQLAWLRKKGVKFHRRVNHGMTHSLYISDPNGYGVEVLYELPREVWGENFQGALDYAEGLPTEGDEAFTDDTNYPNFGSAKTAPAE